MSEVPEGAPVEQPAHARRCPLVSITSNGATAKLAVDGVEIPHLVGVDVSLRPYELPVVQMSMLALEQDVVLDGARVEISGVDMPESIKRALFLHLAQLYGVAQVGVPVLSDKFPECDRAAVPR
ncbi:hypothetical protein D0838_05030 [Bordetella avium]|uniref:hypothetical protein n=1 Tax=Bordetella avium TaxID=521 RepID=UPI000E69DA1C|nr:hypothetical protein [Bordetella avium]RIQ74563.1 hypothetical protein D0838_05030 [Bordetella avium]